MAEVQTEYQTFEKKFKTNKIIDVAFLLVILVFMIVLFFAPTIQFNEFSYHMDILGSDQNSTTTVMKYRFEKSAYIDAFNKFIIENNLNNQSVSVFEYFTITLPQSALAHISNKTAFLAADTLGMATSILLLIIALLAVFIVVGIIITIFVNINLAFNKKSIAKTYEKYKSSTLFSSKTYKWFYLFTVKNCIAFTIIALFPLVLKILMVFANKPSTYAKNMLSAELLLNTGINGVMYAMIIINCLLMYVFTFISKKFSPCK